MGAFSKLNRALERLLGISLVSFGVVMVAALAIQVVGRYVFDYSTVWIVELGQYSFVWVCMLGMALTYRRRGHVALEYDWHRRSTPIRIALQIVVFLCVVFIAGCICYGGYVLMTRFGGTSMPGIGLSMAWVYAAPFICGGFIVVFATEQLIEDLRRGSGAAPDQPSSPTTLGGVV